MNSGYENRRVLDQYLLFHYGTPEQILEGSTVFDGEEAKGLHFPEATVWSALLLDRYSENDQGALRALDVGCAVGRSSFELSRLCAEVIAVDYSQAFIEAAKQMQQGREMKVLRYDEGQLESEINLNCPEAVNPDRVQFELGDAMSLRDDLGEFDVVHAANLLCRLSEPTRFLNRLPALVKPGGQLVMATPCTWSEEFTPKENQPEGSTLDFLHIHLDDSFELQRKVELPFVIRDHARKFQISTSQTSVWVRK
ncbi:MAG: putative 4-mercaptohistidine N1-methyltransferase [Verrucomicrobia bacterium]|nr:putative 4-mercaptohistidine N1-methyltransferase [Verrucomicrobiota bacterium]